MYELNYRETPQNYSKMRTWCQGKRAPPTGRRGRVIQELRLEFQRGLFPHHWSDQRAHWKQYVSFVKITWLPLCFPHVFFFSGTEANCLVHRREVSSFPPSIPKPALGCNRCVSAACVCHHAMCRMQGRNICWQFRAYRSWPHNCRRAGPAENLLLRAVLRCPEAFSLFSPPCADLQGACLYRWLPASTFEEASTRRRTRPGSCSNNRLKREET